MASLKVAMAARRVGTFAILAILMLLICPETAPAQQPISGNYAPGASTGMKGAVQPPGGTFMLENGTLVYTIQNYVNSGGDSVPIPTVDALANRTIIGYVTNLQLFGGNYFPAVVLPFANVAIRPEPGSRKDMSFGDMVLQPLAFGWQKGEWNYQFVYNLWVPTGRFNAGASNNVGKGLFSHMLTGGVTWLQDAEKPWAATLMLRYEFLGEQKDTDIRPGQVMTVEGGVGKEIFRGVDFGLTGYAMFQTTRESGSPATTDTSRYRAFALGPELNWRPSFLTGLQIAVRSYFEFGARNVTEGIFNVFSVAYLF